MIESGSTALRHNGPATLYVPDLKTEPLNEYVQAQHVWVKREDTVTTKMLFFQYRARNHLEVERSHEGVKLSVEFLSEGSIFHSLETVLVPRDISRVQHDVGSPKQLLLEPCHAPFKFAFRIRRFQNDASEDKHGILTIYNVKAVVARLTHKHDLHNSVSLSCVVQP